MIVGVDLDDVILNTSYRILKCVNAYYESDYKWEDIYCYSIEDAFNLDKEVVDYCVQVALQSEIEPVYGAINILNWLTKTEEVWVSVVTRRRNDLLSFTTDYLNKIGLKYYSLFLTHESDSKMTKSDVANSLKMNVFIEDSPETIKDLYEKTNCDILVMDKPWNRTISENDRIYIVNNWMQIRDWFIIRMEDI